MSILRRFAYLPMSKSEDANPTSLPSFKLPFHQVNRMPSPW